MEVRQRTGLQPGDIVDDQWLETHRDVVNQLLKGYDDIFLKRLFNTIA